MELEEEMLDTLISCCSLQLQELTEDQDNSSYPVTSALLLIDRSETSSWYMKGSLTPGLRWPT